MADDCQIVSVAIRERLALLDQKALGADTPSSDGPRPRWLTWVSALIPVLTGAAAAVAFFIDRGAGVGVLVGLVLALPIALVARESGRR